MMVCSQRASTPNFLPPPPFSHACMPPSASWPVPPLPGRARRRRIPPRQPADRELEVRPELRKVDRLGPAERGQLAALQDEDAVGTLGEHALPGAERPPFVPLDRREILRPVGNHLVGAEDVLAAFLPRHRGKPRRRLTGDGVVVYEIRDRQRRNNSHDEHGQASRHVVLLQRIDGQAQSRKSRA